jgi:hypothetical protein
LADTLATVKAAFDAQTQRFLSEYDQALEAWIPSLPAWDAPIRRAIEPVWRRRTLGRRWLVSTMPGHNPVTRYRELE